MGTVRLVSIDGLVSIGHGCVTLPKMSTELRRRARRRALVAARAVTLGSVTLGTLALGGCGSSHTPGDEDAAVAQDASVARDAALVDSGIDAALVDSGTDAALVDSGTDAALVCPPVFPPTTQECCEAEGGIWEGERCIVAVPGPFVPPRMV